VEKTIELWDTLQLVPTNLMLDEKTKIEAHKYALNALRSHFGWEILIESKPESVTLMEMRGVFVTLRYQDKLRGCLGDIETDHPLYLSIQVLTVAAATRDPRFNPVNSNELGEIEIEISILTKPKKITDWRQITLGKHGVIVEKGGRKGVFLPQVAEEGKFTLEEFLSLLCSQKAGLPDDAYLDPTTNLYTFEAEHF
jgi:AmmeMemoRadiSam system protein A